MCVCVVGGGGGIKHPRSPVSMVLCVHRNHKAYQGRVGMVAFRSELITHTPSIAFRHLPPNSARFSYATEGALFISAQLSTDAVNGLLKVWVLI